MNIALRRVLILTISVLVLRVLMLILREYGNYFPANFEAAFLIGMERNFHGLYPIAFYLHIVAGPIVILNLIALSLIKNRSLQLSHFFRHGNRLHQRLGRLQAVLVLFVMVPTGMVMAIDAHAGPIARTGLFLLALATGLAMIQTIRFAIAGKLSDHQKWSERSSLLLLSPLVLRLATGVAIVFNAESSTFYQANAWLSWLLPLLAYEAFLITNQSCNKTLQSSMAIPRP